MIERVKTMSSLLEQIHSPEDLKKLTLKEMKKLSHEIRHFLVHSISKTGGHLSSNLGVVELTIALHYVFNTPTDQLVWDVGHQAYIHKILTGRRSDFPTLKKEDGMSGYPKRNESPYDTFNTGHSSTSISAGYGIAKARDIAGDDYNVVSIIGDGSLTGGMAFEALNNIGQSEAKMIVVLNDNEMSISKNVGGLTRYLCEMRTEPHYLDVKQDVEKLLKRIPGIGENLVKSVRNAKDGLRYLLVPGVLFEELGFNYIGPVDGHDLNALISAMQYAKKSKKPVFVHVKTKKGKGYPMAEKDPTKFHGVSPFNVKTGEFKGSSSVSYSKTYGDTMVELGKKYKNMAAITAAMPEGTGLQDFAELYPDRFFDVGIAEQHAVTFAAGLAAKGVKPVVAIYSSFLQRAYDQILHDVCIQNLPVTFAIDRGGFVGADGATHQGAFDIAMLNHIPNMTVMAPKNGMELKEMMSFAMTHDGPIAYRYPRATASTLFTGMQQPIELGKAEILQKGKEVAIIAYGEMNSLLPEVNKVLKEHGIVPTLVNGRFAKPLDYACYTDLANTHKVIVTVEEGVIKGGFGMEIVNYLSNAGLMPEHMKTFGIHDSFVDHAERHRQLDYCDLNSKAIYDYILLKLQVTD